MNNPQQQYKNIIITTKNSIQLWCQAMRQNELIRQINIKKYTEWQSKICSQPNAIIVTMHN